MHRRAFLSQSALAASGAMLTAGHAVAYPAPLRPLPPAPRADSCIFIWLGGGACQIDTWDPKRLGDPRQRTPGSAYPAMDTNLPGVQVCQHLAKMSRRMDRCVLFRTVHHEVIDEHAAATNRLHTGRPPTGTTLYPSLGAVVSHQLGPRGEGVPPYLLMGYPSASRGPGFLGARHGYVYLVDTDSGPAGLQRPFGLTPERQRRRSELLREMLRTHQTGKPQPQALRDYFELIEAGQQLAGPAFMKVFDLDTESSDLRQRYGGEFGQRCLLARRLVQQGVRFVEVSFNLNFINGTGWDTHNDGQVNQHILIQQLDQALASLIDDLEAHQRLDQTLICVATEFGRPPTFDGGGGRGHQSKAFSVLMAGGGLKYGQVIGQTDELGANIVDRPVSVPDLHATLYHALGINPAEELYDGDRPVPITDQGRAVSEAFREPIVG